MLLRPMGERGIGLARVQWFVSCDDVMGTRPRNFGAGARALALMPERHNGCGDALNARGSGRS